MVGTNKLQRASMRDRTTTMDVVLVIVFALLSLITLYPFYNVVILSLSNTVTVAKHTPYLLPYACDLTGYATIIQDRKSVV